MSPTSPRPPGAAGAARHAACKVHRDSHSIHSRPAPAPRQKQQQPVIIYTHSPKVIRTSPRHFMSIVQKLTGLDSPGPARGARNAGCSAAAQDESSSSSSESCANVHAHAAAPHPYADPRLMPPPPLDAHFVAPDVPLFAPGPSELQLCMPQGFYDQFPAIDAASLGPVISANMNGGAAGNGGPLFSPSMVEAMRTFPDY